MRTPIMRTSIVSLCVIGCASLGTSCRAGAPNDSASSHTSETERGSTGALTEAGPSTGTSSSEGEPTADDSSTGAPTEPACGDGYPLPGELCWHDAMPFDLPGQRRQGVAVADFDEDGHLDALVALSWDDQVALLRGDGHGGLSSELMPMGGYVLDLRAADLNGDGHVDFATRMGWEESEIRLGNGDGSFMDAGSLEAVAGRFELVDVNDDGVLDFVGASGLPVGVNVGNGDGSFQPVRLYEWAGGGIHTGLGIADLDGDGDEDLVVVRNTAHMLVLLNSGDGTYPDWPDSEESHLPPTTKSSALSVADHDRDGNPDAVIALDQEQAAILLLLGQGDGSFVEGSTFDAGCASVSQLQSLDVDGDGALELVALCAEPDALHVYPGNGDGSFDVPVVLPLGGSAVYFAFGDLDEDGAFDFVVPLESVPQVDLLLSNP